MDQHILELVFSYTSTGKDYKNYCLVSKAWYAVISKLFPGGDKFCNHLLTLLTKLPTDERWDYAELSIHSLIPIEYIKANLDKPWDYDELSNNDILSAEFVEEYPDKLWNYDMLALRKNIGWDFVKKHIDKISSYYISFNKGVTWDIVCDNPDINWNYSALSWNENIPWDIIEANIHKSWDFAALTERRSPSLDIIRKFPDKFWGYWNLSIDIAWNIILDNPDIRWDYVYVAKYNKTITWKNVLEIPIQDNVKLFCSRNQNVMKGINSYEHLVDYDALSENHKLTEEYVLVHMDRWNYDKIQSSLRSISWKLLKAIPENSRRYSLLSSRINITPKQFKKIINNPWNYNYLSSKVTWDFVLAFPDKPWNYHILTNNRAITLDIIFNNPTKPWNIDNLSLRNDLTWRDVVNHPEIPWNFRMISANQFSKN